MSRKEKVSIVGGGLVGSLAAVYWGNRGYLVEVYESRPDPRLDQNYEGRSINLALSRRGIVSLEKIGWQTKISDRGLPMFGRMVHDEKGNLTELTYGLKGEAIISIDRKKLNEDLLSLAEKYPNISLFFGHKCLSIDFDQKEIVFQLEDGATKTVQTDYLVGTDGAHSSVRKHLMRKIRMEYSQSYIGHGYKELTMLPSKDGEYRMSHQHLHIWPKHSFMMIALPNKDKTFTCTLFMPYEKFEEIQTESQLLAFYEKNFPDSISLFGQEHLIQNYFKNPMGSLMTVKCKPYHYKNFCVIMGDAAHAMVPFYGQGMNCGFQDVYVLDQILDKHNGNVGAAFEEYSNTRNKDAEAICDLAVENYVEMRHSVASLSFRLKKKVEWVLGTFFPFAYIPKYTMVAFMDLPYSRVLAKAKAQDRFLNFSSSFLLFSSLSSLLAVSAWKLKPLVESWLN